MAESHCFQRTPELNHRNARVQQNARMLMQNEKVAEMDFEKWDFWKIVFCMDRALESAPACHCFKIPKAGYLAKQGDYSEAQSVASDILQMDSTNVDVLYVRGLCFYYEDCIEKAVHFLCRLSGWLPATRRPALLAEMSKHLKQQKKVGIKPLKKEIKSQPMNCTRKSWG